MQSSGAWARAGVWLCPEAASVAFGFQSLWLVSGGGSAWSTRGLVGGWFWRRSLPWCPSVSRPDITVAAVRPADPTDRMARAAARMAPTVRTVPMADPGAGRAVLVVRAAVHG